MASPHPFQPCGGSMQATAYCSICGGHVSDKVTHPNSVHGGAKN